MREGGTPNVIGGGVGGDAVMSLAPMSVDVYKHIHQDMR